MENKSRRTKKQPERKPDQFEMADYVQDMVEEKGEPMYTILQKFPIKEETEKERE